jgi:uncharacterized spore protein YtfJ
VSCLSRMQPERSIRSAQRLFTAKRVYAEPVERDGVTVVPAAVIVGGAGAGGGEDPDGNTGGGAGLGIHARPVGAWVIQDGRAEWKSTGVFDSRRAMSLLPLLGLIALLVLWLARKGD